MALTGQDILDRSWAKARDQGVTKRWPEAEGLLWLNDGRREIINLAPRANTVRTVVTPEAGTRQTLSGMGLTNGLQFIDIPRNMGADGTTSGSSITKVKRAWMDERLRAWHSSQSTEADHWMLDEEDPGACYIYPAKTAGKLEVIHSALLDEMTDVDDPIGLSDVYANPLQWFVLMSFFLKDSEHQKSSSLVQIYASLFAQSLGVRVQNLTGAAQRASSKAQGSDA